MDGFCLPSIGTRHDHAKFIAGVAADDIRLAEAAVKQVGDLFEHCIAGRMPFAVVDGLEVVEIAEHQGENFLGAVRDRQFVVQYFVKCRTIGEARQGIRVAELLQFPRPLGDLAFQRFGVGFGFPPRRFHFRQQRIDIGIEHELDVEHDDFLQRCAAWRAFPLHEI